MSRRASIYIASVITAAVLIAGFLLPGITLSRVPWGAFATLTVLATFAQLFEAESPGRQSFYVHMVFFFAAVLLLPPALFAPVVLVAHLVEWIKARAVRSTHLRAWYIQPFNIGVHVLAGSAAGLAHAGLQTSLSLDRPLALALSVVGSALMYVAVNHLLIGYVLVVARGISWHDSGILAPQSLANDLILVCLGGVVAMLWQVNPWLVPLAMAPLVLMYQALTIPLLKQRAEIDARTGLANAHHFGELFAAELNRARRFGRPLAVIMADLDHFKAINDTYGHQTGNVVLEGIGVILRRAMRDYDIGSRYGGEEFMLVAPEVEPHEAEALAERLRQEAGTACFANAPNGTPIGVTMSVGVACFPGDGTTVEELINAADVAVYEAKGAGRNRVVRASDLPWLRRVAQPPGAASKAAVPTEGSEQRAPAEADEQGAGPGQAGRRAAISAPLVGSGAPASTTTRPAAPKTMEPRTASTAASQAAGQSRNMPEQSRLARLLPQPGVAIAIAALAAGALLAWARSPGLTVGPEPLSVNLEAMAFAGALILAYQYPIHIRLHLKVQLSTMVYYLIAALLPLPLALGAAGLGTLIGEISVRQQRKLTVSDIATAVSRWVVLVLLGSLVAHQPAQGETALALLVACALVLGLGDLLTLPLILASMTGERPLRMIRSLALETGAADGVQYLIGFLGILVSQRAQWALALFVVPVVLVYQATQLLHEVRDSTHQLLESMADTVDLRDPNTGGHSRRVAEYCAQILQEMGLGGPDKALILSAARVHDIGKIGLPDAILYKSGLLTAEERALMQTHPERAAPRC